MTRNNTFKAPPGTFVVASEHSTSHEITYGDPIHSRGEAIALTDTENRKPSGFLNFTIDEYGKIIREIGDIGTHF